MRPFGFVSLVIKVLALAMVFAVMTSAPAAADRGLNEKPRKSAFGFYCEKRLAPATYRGKRVCRPCGKAAGQPACEKDRIGVQCANRLIEKGGMCVSCGGRGEKACPKKEFGYPCEGQMAPNSRNICQPCGVLNQAACRAGKAGEQCGRWLNKDSRNICKPCGGDGQRACPVIKEGSICKPGTGSFDGVCRTCGQNGQRACPAVEQGRQCALWTTKTDGYCRPCGENGQQSCRITDKGKACKPGLKRTLKGICEAKPEYYVEQAAMEELERLVPDIAGAVTRAFNASEDGSLTQQIEDGDASSATSELDDDACMGDTESWSVSATGSVSVVVGGEAEVGFVVPCKDNRRTGADPLKWFYSTGHSLQFGFGAEGGAGFGFWNTDFENLRGKAHGYEFDLVQLVENATAGPIANLKSELMDLKGLWKTGNYDGLGVTVVIGVWFQDYDGDDPRAVENALSDWRPEPIGWTVTVVYGGGWDAGATYSKMTTRQYCSPEMKCAEGLWENNNTELYVTNQREDHITVRVGNGEAETFTRQDFTKRYFNGPDGQKVVFRKNYTVLDYTNDAGRETELKKGLTTEGNDSNSRDALASGDGRATRPNRNDQPLDGTGSGGSKALPVAGAWQMRVASRAIAFDLARISQNEIFMKRRGSKKGVRLTRTSPDTFVGPDGQSLRFVGNQRALWISSDRSNTYQFSFTR